MDIDGEVLWIVEKWLKEGLHLDLIVAKDGDVELGDKTASGDGDVEGTDLRAFDLMAIDGDGLGVGAEFEVLVGRTVAILDGDEVIKVKEDVFLEERNLLFTLDLGWILIGCRSRCGTVITISAAVAWWYTGA